MKKQSRRAHGQSISPARAARHTRATRRAALAAILPELLEDRQLMSTYTVTTTADDGSAGSLRAAINSVNAGQTDTIQFNIAGAGIQTISLTSALPAIQNPVTIDGTTQPGYASTPLIELNGLSAGLTNGLDFEANSGGSAVKGLEIDGFSGTFSDNTDGNGIVLNAPNIQVTQNVIWANNYAGLWVQAGGSGATIENNLIGLDNNEQPTWGNEDGVDVFGTSATPVTGVTVSGNTISGNYGDAVALQYTIGDTIQRNFIGTQPSGVLTGASYNPYENYGNGVLLGAGALADLVQGNVIDRSGGDGIRVDTGSTDPAMADTIQGNDIGVDVSGTYAGLATYPVPVTSDHPGVAGSFAGGNIGNGIDVLSGVLLIGGTAPGEGNVIGGNSGDGIDLNGGQSTIYGNFIGIGSDGLTPLGNAEDGIAIGSVVFVNNVLTIKTASSNNVIGGDAPGEGNVIADNGAYAPGPVYPLTVGGRGVDVVAGTGNSIEGNAIFGNQNLGIDLGDDGATPNSADAGATVTPNNFVFAPDLGSASWNGSTVTITGSVTGAPNSVVVIDFYSDPTAVHNGYGEGQVWAGSMTVALDNSGQATFTSPALNHPDLGGPPSQVWTATITDSGGNTSEFAQDVSEARVSPAPPPPPPVNSTISGVVENDLTGDGFTADDQPLAGVTVDLFLNGSATPYMTVVSAGDGSYAFTGLGAGNYFVQEVLPANTIETGGSAGYAVDGSSSVIATGNNFDNFQNVTISGAVYTDLTGNGLTGDDTPMGGVSVNLYSGTSTTGVLLATATTAANGAFAFQGVGPGSYFVQEVVPAGYTETGGAAGHVTQAVSGSNVSADNFANYLPPTGSISGYVFCDDNLNGVFDATSQDGVLSPESGEGGATVTLTGTTLAGLTVNTSVTTAADGSYSFTSLAAGTYTVSLTGYSPDHQAEQSHGTVTIAESKTINLAAGQAVSGAAEGAATTNNGLDFAEIAPGGLEGFVWEDTNNDGKVDFNEAGIVNVTIELSGVTYTGAAVSETTATDSNGEYLFTNLQPGTYSLTEVTPGGFTDGKDTVGSLGGSEVQSSSTGSTCYNDSYGRYGYNCFTGYSSNCYANSGTSNNGNNCGGNSSSCNAQSNCGGSGWSSGAANAQDVFSSIQIGGCEDVGVGYNFGEKGSSLTSSSGNNGNGGCSSNSTNTATLAFWHNAHGQALICSLNGGPNSTALGTWLATMFPNLYGASAKVNFAKMTNLQIAAFYNANDFTVSGIKLDAAVLSAAMSAYVTNSSWAGGNYAAKYGFTVSAQGCGYDTLNVGNNGAAFGVADNSTISILQALDDTDQQAKNGVLYNGNTSLRAEAYNVYAAVAQQGQTA